MFKEAHLFICKNCGKEFLTKNPKTKCCCKKCAKQLWLKEIKELGHNKYNTVGRKRGCIPWNKDKECPQLCNENNGFYNKHHTIETKEKIKAKILITKTENNSFNISKEEQEILILLKERFPNLKTQYKSEEYPFLCDFYIPELNLYIEYQGHFSHGFKPFVGTENDLKKLYNWQEKVKQGKPSYKQAIETWTIRDPLKRKIVKENNLNWLEFFNMNDFIEWYKKG